LGAIVETCPCYGPEGIGADCKLVIVHAMAVSVDAFEENMQLASLIWNH